MTDQSIQTDAKSPSFSSRLQAAREAQGLERKDAAKQLRLNEKIIIMMEKDKYSPDLPITFIRGYLRAYGKLLQIPEQEIKKALDSIKHIPATASLSPLLTSSQALHQPNHFMQWFTYLVVLSLLALVTMWWYTNSNPILPTVIESQISPLSENINKQPEPPVTAAQTPTPSAPAQENSLDSNEKMANHTSPPVQTALVKKPAAQAVTHKNVAEDDDDDDDDDNNSD